MSNELPRSVGCNAFVMTFVWPSSYQFHTTEPNLISLNAAAKSKTPKKKVTSDPIISLRGFGGKGGSTSSSRGRSSSESDAQPNYEIDRSKEALEYYDYIEKGCTEFSNLKRVALAHFSSIHPDIGHTKGLRGVVALRPIKKNEIIIQIPYSMSINLGSDRTDVTVAALNLLRSLCQYQSTSSMTTIFKSLPSLNGVDCKGSTDFFSMKALDALQFPPILKETLLRRENVRSRFEAQVQPKTLLLGNDAEESTLLVLPDGSNVTEDHLRWAVWLVASRVITVQGPSDDEFTTPSCYKLLIPLIDMCNHDRNSPHILSGRATTGGTLKIVAGCNIAAGDEITICYGGGVEGNDRFIQDYGFLDNHVDSFNIVARMLLAKGKFSSSEIKSILERFRESTIEEDEAELSKLELEADIRSAIQFRLGVKKALAPLQLQ